MHLRRDTLLDQLIPTCDAASRHTIRVAADPARVYDVIRHADLARPWLVRVLMALRLGPAWLAARLGGHGLRESASDSWPSVGPVSFTVVAEAPGQEIVLGIMGRFWTPTGCLVHATEADLRQLPPPGLAQGFWSFRVEPSGSGTLLSTETRVRCGDPVTRRHFARYWCLIRPGSALIRVSVLRSVRRQAERQVA